MLPDFRRRSGSYERAERSRAFLSYPQTRTFAELLIDCEEDRALRAVLVGMLREVARSDRLNLLPTGRRIGEYLLREVRTGMASFRRHLGLRVAAVAVMSALVVFGLQAPAYGATPTISSFSPTSGPAGCVVVITGTNFKDPIVTSVDIGGTPVSEFKVV